MLSKARNKLVFFVNTTFWLSLAIIYIDSKSYVIVTFVGYLALCEIVVERRPVHDKKVFVQTRSTSLDLVS